LRFFVLSALFVDFFAVFAGTLTAGDRFRLRSNMTEVPRRSDHNSLSNTEKTEKRNFARPSPGARVGHNREAYDWNLLSVHQNSAWLLQ
jgi:hypothetical protein